MKTTLLRALGFGFCGWFLALTCIHATSPVRITCVVCAEDYVTNRVDCPRCRFIHIGGRIALTVDERAHLRAFLASEEYLASLSGSILARTILLYEQVPMSSFDKAGVLLWASAMLAKHDEDQTRLLTLALAALRTAESEQIKESDRPVLLLRLTEVLRRLSRFDEARIQLDKLRTLNPAFPNPLVDVLVMETELVEERLPFPRPMFLPIRGKISATSITGGTSVFGLPINKRPVIANQPATWKYPFEMRYSRIAGEAQVSLAISAAGEVMQAKLLRTSQPEFSHAAVEFARACSFAPMETPNGPTAFECTVAVLFTLNEE